MEAYVGEMEEELVQALFLSFLKQPRAPPTTPTSLKGKIVKEISNAGADVPQIKSTLADKVADKLHGLTEKIHVLGHSRHDSGSNSIDLGRRSRTGWS